MLICCKLIEADKSQMRLAPCGPEVEMSSICKPALRRFLWINNLHTGLPPPSFPPSSCEQRTPEAVLLFNLGDRALSRKRWGTELIVVAAIGDRSCAGLQMGLGAGGSYRLLQGICFLLPGSVEEAKAVLPGMWCAGCAHSHKHTHRPP